jgi:hypothetical protein
MINGHVLKPTFQFFFCIPVSTMTPTSLPSPVVFTYACSLMQASVYHALLQNEKEIMVMGISQFVGVHFQAASTNNILPTLLLVVGAKPIFAGARHDTQLVLA